MTFAPATTAPMKYLHVMPNIKSIYKQNPYSNHNLDINLNLKPYHNPNPIPNYLEKSKTGAIFAGANVKSSKGDYRG